SVFYSKFYSQLTALDCRLKAATKDYQLALGNLAKQLKARKGDILNAKDYESVDDDTAKLTQIWQEYSDLCAQSELFSSSLADEQTKAKADLRLKEVAEYLLTIDYQTQLNSIETLQQKRDEAQQAQEAINANITKKQAQVTAKKRELNDEEKG
ncbi:hypothetical protein EAY04_25375, partial [Vibrio anguillarum]|nr:hypothetical protein [Vibrio anguillarum]